MRGEPPLESKLNGRIGIFELIPHALGVVKLDANRPTLDCSFLALGY